MSGTLWHLQLPACGPGLLASNPSGRGRGGGEGGGNTANKTLKRVQEGISNDKAKPVWGLPVVQDLGRKHEVCWLASIKLKLPNFKDTKCLPGIQVMCSLTGARLHRHTCAHARLDTTHTDSGAAAHPANTFTFRNAFCSSAPPLSLAEGLCQTQKALLSHTWTACWNTLPVQETRHCLA